MVPSMAGAVYGHRCENKAVLNGRHSLQLADQINNFIDTKGTAEGCF